MLFHTLLEGEQYYAIISLQGIGAERTLQHYCKHIPIISLILDAWANNIGRGKHDTVDPDKLIIMVKGGGTSRPYDDCTDFDKEIGLLLPSTFWGQANLSFGKGKTFAFYRPKYAKDTQLSLMCDANNHHIYAELEHTFLKRYIC